jgi:phage baseplate assembly protein gpV
MAGQRFQNAIRAQAAVLDNAVGRPRFATVTSFNPADYTARVKWQPEGTLSGWLPVLSPWTGSGWGIVCSLNAGDQVLVVSQEGDAEHGVVVGRAYSNSTRPPAVSSGEFWIVHSSGSSLKLKADGTISITGDLHVTGDVYDSHGSVAHLRATFNAHTHTAPGGGRTSTPNETD